MSDLKIEVSSRESGVMFPIGNNTCSITVYSAKSNYERDKVMDSIIDRCNSHDKLVSDLADSQAEVERLRAMSIESINGKDLVTLISVGFRHAEIEGSFEVNDIYDAFNVMIDRRAKKPLSKDGE